MKDRHTGQALILIGCICMLTGVFHSWIAAVFILSGLAQI